MINIRKFRDFLNEAQSPSDAQFIADLLIKAASGPGTDEELLSNAVLAIKDENTLIKVNQILNKEGTYQHLQDLIDDEIGFLDGYYKVLITGHLNKQRIAQSTKKIAATATLATKDQVIKAIKDRVTASENFIPKPYKDPRGIWTIGIGFNLQNRNDVQQKLGEAGVDTKNINLIVTKRQGTITRPQADKLLILTLSEAYEQAKSIFSTFVKQPAAIQGVLTDMAFNVGPNNLKKFSKFISHINTNKYAMAADEMRNSLWYKQVGNRAKDLESIVRGSV